MPRRERLLSERAGIVVDPLDRWRRGRAISMRASDRVESRGRWWLLLNAICFRWTLIGDSRKAWTIEVVFGSCEFGSHERTVEERTLGTLGWQVNSVLEMASFECTDGRHACYVVGRQCARHVADRQGRRQLVHSNEGDHVAIWARSEELCFEWFLRHRDRSLGNVCEVWICRRVSAWYWRGCGRGGWLI